jgi:hypothetical protein
MVSFFTDGFQDAFILCYIDFIASFNACVFVFCVVQAGFDSFVFQVAFFVSVSIFFKVGCCCGEVRLGGICFSKSGMAFISEDVSKI